MNSSIKDIKQNGETYIKIRHSMKSLCLKVALLLVSASFPAFAQLGNVWHVPAETRPSGVYATGMRDALNPNPSASVTFYQGVSKGGGDNQTGGTLYYRFGGGSWQHVALNWHANETGTSVQIWKSSVSMPSTAGTVVDYYFATTFDNRTSPTYIYYNGATAKTATESTAQASPFSFTLTTPVAAASFTVTTSTTGTLNADYTTSKLYVDELAGDAVPITISFAPGVQADEVELWTNLNNRDRAGLDADGDGIHDGILPPAAPETKPVGYTSGPYPSNGYFQAVPLTGSGGTYATTLTATKTGAYRLTGRYKIAGQNTWTWFSGRDHCITVAPKLARNLRMYEINVLNVNATGPSEAQRSTFESLSDSANGRVNLDSLLDLGINSLWFQPIHPNGREGREKTNGVDYEPGSPYAVKNFFEVMELMSLGNTRTSSMAAFQTFVTNADTKGMNIILDAPFNHTAWDCEVSTQGLALFSEAGLNTSGWSASDKIKDREVRFYSSNGAAGTAYSVPANSATDIASAPDRNDFGKWADVKDVFFGRYTTLVTGFPTADSSRATVALETDQMTWDDLKGAAGSNGAVTRAVWKYFARYVPYWLEKTGLPAGSSKADQAYKGIDGLRADFGQGMPPQFWEYVINVARTHKWSFVFMTESLDGGAVTYRSNRHFDILNENIVSSWQSATTTTGHRDIFETRRTSYGQGLVLLNNTSHDEAGYSDPWEAFIRYAVGSTMDGAPMVMYGQEIGTAASLSFDKYEVNFGKNIPHFKAWNSMQPQWTQWSANTFGVKNLIPAYAGAGKAREFSPALRSSSRWFLNPSGTTTADSKIFAVAKYEEANASPASKDVVFGFVNLDRSTSRQNTFGIPSGLGTLLGIKSGRNYNVRNIAAYLGPNNEYPDRRNRFLWGDNGLSGSTILSVGIYVSLPAVPSTDSAWGSAPFEAQYLKLYDVTPPPALTGAPTTSSSITANGTTTVTWNAVNDPEGLTPTYRVTASNGSTVETTSTSASFPGLTPGTYTFTVTALNPNDPSKTSTPSSPSPSVRSLYSTGDDDGDGQTNADELIAGTDPLNPSSRFQIESILSTIDGIELKWTPVLGRTYTVEARQDLSSGTWISVATGLTTGSYTDSSSLPSKKFYRLKAQ
jgi:glycosidase